MPKIRDEAPYDPKNKSSILKHAKMLKGQTLNDFQIVGEMKGNNKGGFGQILERGYFYLDNNNKPVPDFKDVGMELKSTPMLKLKDGSYSPKERLVLGIINYDDIVGQDFEESFMIKNQDLLIVFYLYEKGKMPLEYKILDITEWIFPENDLEIIRRDWKEIRGMVEQGRAHEISGGMTFYLEAMTKGAGHDKDMRTQPFSDILARQRAFGLKGKYVKQIFNSLKDFEPIIKNPAELKYRHIEDIIAEKFAPYTGLSVEDILNMTDIELKGGKDRYASLARAMLGVKKRNIEEFEKAGIIMKTVRLESTGNLKESISFPYIRFDEIVDEEWEESATCDIMSSRFLFVVFQKGSDNKNLFFKGIKFWSMSNEDLETVHSVWQDTVNKIRDGDYGNFIPLSGNRISHVRPHGRDSRDRAMGPDGNKYKKQCFWLNAGYVKDIVKEFSSPIIKN